MLLRSGSLVFVMIFNWERICLNILIILHRTIYYEVCVIFLMRVFGTLGIMDFGTTRAQCIAYGMHACSLNGYSYVVFSLLYNILDSLLTLLLLYTSKFISASDSILILLFFRLQELNLILKYVIAQNFRVLSNPHHHY